MSIDFTAAMRRARTAVQSLDVAEATSIIRQALGGAPEAAREAAPDALRPAPLPGPARSRARPAAPVEDAEIVAPPAPEPAGAPEAPPSAPRALRDVVRLLRERRPPMPLRSRPTPEVRVPDGARFEALAFRGAAGARDYRLYTPASLAGAAPRGLVVMLHGCTQTPEDFAAGTRMNALAEAHGLLVAWPQQGQMHNPNGCWNWFRPEDQRRGAGEPAILAGLTEEIVRTRGVPRDRVFVAGLSAGGAMAAILAETWPDLFAAAGIHSGLARGAANDVPSAFAAMRGSFAAGPAPETPPRLIVFQGEADVTVHASNAPHLLARAAGAGPAETERLDAGRPVTRQVRRAADGTPASELWLIAGAGHAWSGGDPAGSYADPAGPDASAEMLRFFLAVPRR